MENLYLYKVMKTLDIYLHIAADAVLVTTWYCGPISLLFI